MFPRGLRRFATTAHRMAEISANVDASNQYRVQLAKAQGHVNGFVGGRDPSYGCMFLSLTDDVSVQQLGILL